MWPARCRQTHRLRCPYRTTKGNALPLVGDIEDVALGHMHVADPKQMNRPLQQADATAAPKMLARAGNKRTKAPLFEVAGFNLKEALGKGPVVLVFYRGLF